MKFGLLLVNLGTPDDPTPKSVGRYLNEFLMDPYVIDISFPLRWLLVKCLIVPRRKYTSAHAYQTVWTKRGSPLLFHLVDLVELVRKKIGDDWIVEYGMRYGDPSIRSGLEKLRTAGVENLIVLPLYPQYAESSSRTAIEKVESELQTMRWNPKLEVIRSFHDEPGHIAAWVELLRTKIRTHNPDSKTHILFSYHGLPERHLKKTDTTRSYCLDGGRPIRSESTSRKYHCCEKALKEKCPANQTCYRAQAIETTNLIVKKMGLADGDWSISFQSRLGRTPWIKPYTDEVIPQLARSGVTDLTVITPSFTADCLETIEEIGDRARKQFLDAGGRNFARVECLNSHPTWAQTVADLAQAHR